MASASASRSSSNHACRRRVQQETGFSSLKRRENPLIFVSIERNCLLRCRRRDVAIIGRFRRCSGLVKVIELPQQVGIRVPPWRPLQLAAIPLGTATHRSVLYGGRVYTTATGRPEWKFVRKRI
jgi:hypothetical protein